MTSKVLYTILILSKGVDMKYNEIIKEGQRIRKWTNSDLGRELGKTRQAIGMFLNKSGTVEMRMFLEYCWVMGLDVYFDDEKIRVDTNINALIKEMIKSKGFTQLEVADKIGLSSQTVITARLDDKSDRSIRIDSMLEILNAIGVKVIVSDRMGSEKSWELSIEEESEEERLLREFEEKKKELEEKGLL